MAAQGVYWIGNDGNIYSKIAGQGVTNQGSATNRRVVNSLRDIGLHSIANPGNPQKTTSSSSGGASYSYTPPAPKVPAIDYAGLTAQARAQAEASTNPYYQQLLNNLLNEQKVQRTQKQESTQFTIGQFEKDLENTLAANEVSRGRTTEDTARNIANINTQEDQFQTDSGQKYESDRLQQAQQLAAGGQVGGLANQQQESLQQQNATAEQRQLATNQLGRDEQELSKARTFEDLATSGRLAGEKKESGVKQANVDLANFIELQGLELTDKKTSLETNRARDIESKTAAARSQLIVNWLNSIADPATRSAAYAQYGGLV